MPELAPGALDAAAILRSVNETLLPIVERKLEEVTEQLGAAVVDKETDSDLLSAFRGELMRRVLPQFTEAVRTGVLEGVRTRQMHLAQLAFLHRQALEAKTLQGVLTRLDHEVVKAGLRIIGDTDDQSLFNVVEDQPGVMKKGPVTLELMVPAYVDKESGKLIERGWLRAVAEVPLPKSSPAPAKLKPGQKRRSKHARVDEKRPQKEAPVQEDREKRHRGRESEGKPYSGNGWRDDGARLRTGGIDGRQLKRRGTR